MVGRSSRWLGSGRLSRTEIAQALDQRRHRHDGDPGVLTGATHEVDREVSAGIAGETARHPWFRRAGRSGSEVAMNASSSSRPASTDPRSRRGRPALRRRSRRRGRPARRDRKDGRHGAHRGRGAPARGRHRRAGSVDDQAGGVVGCADHGLAAALARRALRQAVEVPVLLENDVGARSRSPSASTVEVRSSTTLCFGRARCGRGSDRRRHAVPRFGRRCGRDRPPPMSATVRPASAATPAASRRTSVSWGAAPAREKAVGRGARSRTSSAAPTPVRPGPWPSSPRRARCSVAPSPAWPLCGPADRGRPRGGHLVVAALARRLRRHLPP